MSDYSITQTKAANTIFYKSAVAYAEKLEWPVFPLKPKDKTPIYKGGFHKATKDINQIKEWWTDHPEANIGIPTAVSGFIALDIDIRHSGDESLQELKDHYGELPETVEAITGSGGSHLLFKDPGGISNRANIRPGIDVRGEGGYIVVAPSLHPSGGAYEWELSSRPLEIEIAEAPKWLLHLIKEEKQPEGKTYTHWTSLLQGIGEGGRNEAAASLTGMLLRKNIHPAIAYELLRCWNERNDPALPVEELDKTYNSILNKEIRRLKQRGR
ncbi:bifunctional DNA primase/polymerase [Halobacillus halophilus]|uniref:bifunctional DNA primase/polymerase n=1 Tax=Halobacillus halophilus TaxID=1570 RepID=UPI001CD4612A|nr:bifunctional DNA primase/polymerase [Halobacillus halophilus]MCA1011384.1 bifunctional DNA primase/polymerase [Halobacillus halophilus]